MSTFVLVGDNFSENEVAQLKQLEYILNSHAQMYGLTMERYVYIENECRAAAIHLNTVRDSTIWCVTAILLRPDGKLVEFSRELALSGAMPISAGTVFYEEFTSQVIENAVERSTV